jgi:hypothetical protein
MGGQQATLTSRHARYSDRLEVRPSTFANGLASLSWGAVASTSSAKYLIFRCVLIRRKPRCWAGKYIPKVSCLLVHVLRIPSCLCIALLPASCVTRKRRRRLSE